MNTWYQFNQRHLQKLIGVLVSVAIYIAAFLPLYPLVGDGILMISILPLIVVNCVYGFRGGMTGTVLLFFLNVFLLRFALPNPSTGSLLNFAAGSVIHFSTAIAISYLRVSRQRTRIELEKRQQTERALEESESKLRSTFENMRDAISLHELMFDEAGNVINWKILDVNSAYTRLTGITRETAVGALATNLLVEPEKFASYCSIFQKVVYTGETYVKELEQPVNFRYLQIQVTRLSAMRVAVMLGDITEQKKMILAEQSQRQMAEALRDIAAALTDTLRLEDVLDKILFHLYQITSFDAVNIMLVEGGRVAVVRHQGYKERDLEDYISDFQADLETVPGLRWMASNRRALVISDTSKADSWLVFPPTSWIHSYAGLPIIARGELIGFLNFNSAQANFFHSESIDWLMPFGDQAALAIANARAYEEITRQAHRMEIINRTSSALNKPIDTKTVYNVALDCVLDALNLSQATLLLVEKNYNRLVIVADRSENAENMIGRTISLNDNALAEEVARTKQPILVQDPQVDPRITQIYRHTIPGNIQSILIVPLLNNEETIGAIISDLLHGERRFAQEDIDIAIALANMVALRIEQARLFEEEHRRASELAMLHAITLEITDTHNTGELLERIMRSAAWLVKARGGSLYILGEDQELLHCKVSFQSPYNQVGSTLELGCGAAGRVAISGQPLLVPDYLAWPQRISAANGLTESFSLLSVPIVRQSKVIGVMQLIREVDDAAFNDHDMDLLSLLSFQVAISLENSRLYEEIQRLAIQDSLTGLFNRRGIINAAEREVERARRYERSVVLCMLDVDHFKRVNDTYGHPVGDEVLVGISRYLQNNLRGIDLIGRYGGEEFLFVLVENELASAQMVAERMCQRLSATPIITSVGNIAISVSIGLAGWHPAYTSLSDVIQAADEALYCAKRSGRNRVCCAALPESASMVEAN